MNPTLDDDQAADLLARLATGVPESAPPLAAIAAQATRRRRRRATWLAGAVGALVVTGSGIVAAALTQADPSDQDTASTPVRSGVASPTSPGQGTSDPQTLAALQGVWTLTLTNAAPDGQIATKHWPGFTMSIDGNDFSTTDGVEAIEGRFVAGPMPSAGAAGDLSVLDIRTASAPPSPGTPTSRPPVLETLRALGRLERNGDTFLLLARNSAITAVLRPHQAGIGRVEGSVHTEPALPDDGSGGVRVTLTSTIDGHTASTTSDGDGGFGLDLPAGSYTVSVDGGVCAPADPVQVRESETTHGTWDCPGR